LSERVQGWLSPPDPSTNHDKACNTQLDGSAKWFIEGTTFREWKEKKIGSLLWISGNRSFLPPVQPLWLLIPFLILQRDVEKLFFGARFFCLFQ
jgi:hypothetical protein